MVNINYANAYKEVLIVINNLVKEDYEKIPREYIEFLETNSNNKHEFEYNTSKNFEQQDLLDDTKYILFGLFEKFAATDVQKAKIKSFKINYNNKLEKQKREKYNSEEIFKSKQNNSMPLKIEEPKEKLEMVKYKKQKLYQKIFAKILKIFRRN